MDAMEEADMDALMNLGDGVDRRGNKVILPEATANPVV